MATEAGVELLQDPDYYPHAHYPAAGVKSDFETLLKRFADTTSIRYEQFQQIWQEMKMSFIYSGRQDDGELKEFTEEVIQLALPYWLPPYDFQIRVGGLYLIYGLFVKQLFEPKVKVRITLEQWKDCLSFLVEVQENQHLDVEFVFHKLRFLRAFHFVGTAKEVNMLDSTGHAEDGNDEDIIAVREQSKIAKQKSIISEILDPDCIEQLSTIHDQYSRMKCAIAGPRATKPDPSLDLIQSNLVQYITKTAASHEWWRLNKLGKKPGSSRKRQDSGQTTSESEGESGSDRGSSASSTKKPGTSILSIRSEIKSRALSKTATADRGRRHRQVVLETDLQVGSPPGALPSPASARVARGESSEDEDMEDSGMSASGRSGPESPAKAGLLHMPSFKHLEETTRGRKKRKAKDKPSRSKQKKDAVSTQPSESMKAEKGPTSARKSGRPKKTVTNRVEPVLPDDKSSSKKGKATRGRKPKNK